MKRWLPLALIAAVLVTSLVLLAERPARASTSCSGGCTMKVPVGCSEYGWISQLKRLCYWDCSTGTCQDTCHEENVVSWGCKSPAYTYTSTNCVFAGAPGDDAPCYCPYQGAGELAGNSCPDPKP